MPDGGIFFLPLNIFQSHYDHHYQFWGAGHFRSWFSSLSWMPAGNSVPEGSSGPLPASPSGWRGNYFLGVRICSQEGVCAGGSLCGLSTKDRSSDQLCSRLVSLDGSCQDTGVVPGLRAESLIKDLGQHISGFARGEAGEWGPCWRHLELGARLKTAASDRELWG